MGDREKSKNETPPLKGLQVDTPSRPQTKIKKTGKQAVLPHPTIRKMRKEMRRITGGEEKRTMLDPLW